MRVHIVALLVVASGALHAQDRCGHAGRNALIGGAVGGTLMVGATFTVPRSNEPPPRRIMSTRALMVTWAGAWGAGIGAAIAAGGNRCFMPDAHRDAAGRCGSAVRTGALRGSIAGAAQGFLMSPILAWPVLLTATKAKPVNLDHIMGLFTLGGAVIGAPLGAFRAADQCQHS